MIDCRTAASGSVSIRLVQWGTLSTKNSTNLVRSSLGGRALAGRVYEGRAR